MECFLTMFSFSPTAGKPAVEKYELLNCIFIVHNASNSQLFEKISKKIYLIVTFGSEILQNY